MKHWETFATTLLAAAILLLFVAAGDACGSDDGYLSSSFCYGTHWTADCPCGNWSNTPLEGCTNSTGSGAHLTMWGPGHAVVQQAVPDEAVFLFRGTKQVHSGYGAPWNDGLRCVSQDVVRVATGVADRLGEAHWQDVEVPDKIGDTWYYQSIYRDSAGPCGTGWNTTSALAVQRLF